MSGVYAPDYLRSKAKDDEQLNAIADMIEKQIQSNLSLRKENDIYKFALEKIAKTYNVASTMIAREALTKQEGE